MSNEERIHRMASNLAKEGRLDQEKNYMQHGTTTVYEHSVHVAVISLAIANRFRLKINQNDLIRGALLHDYFLYDWHEKSDTHRLHGFSHASKALENAKADYNLGEIEEDIIEKHMFPLNLTPPKYKEAWIVCLADKYCAVKETFKNKKDDAM